MTTTEEVNIIGSETLKSDVDTLKEHLDHEPKELSRSLPELGKKLFDLPTPDKSSKIISEVA